MHPSRVRINQIPKFFFTWDKSRRSHHLAKNGRKLTHKKRNKEILVLQLLKSRGFWTHWLLITASWRALTCLVTTCLWLTLIWWQRPSTSWRLSPSLTQTFLSTRYVITSNFVFSLFFLLAFQVSLVLQQALSGTSLTRFWTWISILKKVHISAALLFGSGSVITRFYVAESASIRANVARCCDMNQEHWNLLLQLSSSRYTEKVRAFQPIKSHYKKIKVLNALAV